MADQPAGFLVAVVDDDRSVLDSLEMLLESAGHAVCLFGSAEALLESGRLPELDGLISDIGLPGMDGFQLLRRIHASRPELPVILITGQSDLLNRMPDTARDRCRVLKKPIDGHMLLAMIDEALGIP